MTRTTLQKTTLALTLAAGMLFTATAHAQIESTPVSTAEQSVRGWAGQFNTLFPQYIEARAIARAYAEQLAAMRDFEVAVTSEIALANVEQLQAILDITHRRVLTIQQAYEVARAEADRLESLLNDIVFAVSKWQLTAGNTVNALDHQRTALYEAYNSNKQVVVAILDALETGRGDANLITLRAAQNRIQAINAELESVNLQISRTLKLAEVADSVITQWHADAANRN